MSRNRGFESLSIWVKNMEHKVNPGSVFVATGRNPIVEVSTEAHMRNANKPLIAILKEICEEARVYANEIFDKYSYPDKEWFPCGSADLVLKWNDLQNRKIILLFKKEAEPKVDKKTQAMRYEEAVCRLGPRQACISKHQSLR